MRDRDAFRESLRQALREELPGPGAQEKAWPSHLPSRSPSPQEQAGYRDAAVLLLLFPNPSGELRLPLIERPPTMPHHPGQLAFAGGRVEPGESPLEAALRETHEELGLDPAAIDVLGALSPVWIPVTRFRVEVFVGWLLEEPVWLPDPREVHRLLFADPDRLAREGPSARYLRRRADATFEAPAFPVEGGLVWGATALMLAEFGEVWKRLVPEEPR